MNFPKLDPYRLPIKCCGWRMTPVAGWWAWRCIRSCSSLVVLMPFQVRND